MPGQGRTGPRTPRSAGTPGAARSFSQQVVYVPSPGDGHPFQGPPPHGTPCPTESSYCAAVCFAHTEPGAKPRRFHPGDRAWVRSGPACDVLPCCAGLN